MQCKLEGLRADSAYRWPSANEDEGQSTNSPVSPCVCGKMSAIIQCGSSEGPEKDGASGAPSSNFLILTVICFDFLFPCLPVGSEGKPFACNVGDLGSIPGSGRSPGEGNGNPLQYACLENPMNGGTW